MQKDKLINLLNMEDERVRSLQEIVFRKTIKFTRRQATMINDIMTELGYDTVDMVIFDAIATRHKKLFPAHKPSISELIIREQATVESTARKKVLKKKEKEKAVKEDLREYQLTIVEKLKGEITVDNKTGGEVCNYFVYNHSQRYEQNVPLEMLNDDLVNNQFYPNKQAVAKHYPEILN